MKPELNPTRARPAAWMLALAGLLAAGCAALPGPAASVDEARPSPPAAWTNPVPGAPDAPGAPGSTPAPAAAATPAVADDLLRMGLADPALPGLVDAALAASADLADAAARLAEARALRVAGQAALGPRADAAASIARGRADPGAPAATRASAALSLGWDPDLSGGATAARDAAQARLLSAEARWHDARSALAAEVAATLVARRACEAQLAPLQADAASRADTARLTGLTAKAGLDAPSQAALARAAAAQANDQLRARRARCDSLAQGLAALAALDAATVEQRLAGAAGRLPEPAGDATGVRVPAQALAGRADLRDAELQWLAAAHEVTVADAARLPRLSLAGSIGPVRVSSGGGSTSGTTWTVGPVSLSIPVFDGGVLRADAEAARARHDAAGRRWAAVLRQAVREVEDALIVLDSTAARLADARIAREGYEQSLRAAEARWRGGLGSLFELEDARRTALQAEVALIELQQERLNAWIDLQRATGTGLAAAQPPVTSAAHGVPRQP